MQRGLECKNVWWREWERVRERSSERLFVWWCAELESLSIGQQPVIDISNITNEIYNIFAFDVHRHKCVQHTHLQHHSTAPTPIGFTVSMAFLAFHRQDGKQVYIFRQITYVCSVHHSPAPNNRSLAFKYVCIFCYLFYSLSLSLHLCSPVSPYLSVSPVAILLYVKYSKSLRWWQPTRHYNHWQRFSILISVLILLYGQNISWTHHTQLNTIRIVSYFVFNRILRLFFFHSFYRHRLNDFLICRLCCTKTFVRYIICAREHWIAFVCAYMNVWKKSVCARV